MVMILMSDDKSGDSNHGLDGNDSFDDDEDGKSL